MSRRAVLATLTAVTLLGGAAAPALASPLSDPSVFCVLTDYDPKTGKREGFCVWAPVEPPFSADAAR
jgi:hypothetical protein